MSILDSFILRHVQLTSENRQQLLRSECSADIIKMKVVADSKAGLNNGETENFALKEKALTAGHIGGGVVVGGGSAVTHI